MKNTLNIIILINLLLGMNTYGQDLAQHKWNSRVIIVKTTNVDSSTYKQQLKEFSNANTEFIDRRLVLYTLVKEDFTRTDFKDTTATYSGKVSKKIATRLLSQDKSFQVVLIGLDGGVKLKQSKVLTKQDLFNTIDAMPMRSSEIKN